MLLALLPKILTFAPAVGLLGKAAYDALNQRDLATAGQDLLNAAAILGIGIPVHATASSLAKR